MRHNPLKIALAFLFLIQLCKIPDSFGQDLEMLQIQIDSLEQVHKSYAASGDYQQAAQALQNYNNLTFRWQILSDSLEIEEAKKTYNLNIQAAKIELEKIKLENQQQIFLITTIIGLILVIAIFIIRKNIKKKTRQEAHLFHLNQSREFVEAELKEEQFKRSKEEKARLEQTIELKNQKLSSQLLQLLSKNQLLLEVQGRIEKINHSPQALKEIQREIRAQINPEEDWKIFLNQFKAVYPNFLDQLSSQFPRLTGNDFKLCVLIRLQFSTKEMAALLGLNSDSVKTARYRLSKKLNLDKDQRLHDYLMLIG